MSKYCITNGRDNICRIVINGVDHFEVWRGGKCIGRYRAADEARESCK